MRKLITIEGIGDTSKIAKLLSKKLQGTLFNNKPAFSVRPIAEMIPFTMQQMTSAFAMTQLKDNSFIIVNEGFRALKIAAGFPWKEAGFDIAYSSFEDMLFRVIAKEAVERFHIFILQPQRGYAEQVSQIQKCEQALGGGKYIIVHLNNISTEEIVDFIIEEVK